MTSPSHDRGDSPVDAAASDLARWLWLQAAEGLAAGWMDEATERMRTAFSATLTAVVSASGGHWRAVALAGESRTLPYELLAESLDRGAAVADQQWYVCPLRSADAETSTDQVLLVLYPAPDQHSRRQACQQAAKILDAALRLDRRLDDLTRRREWLETMLDVAAQWRGTLDMQALLEQVAEAATRLLRAERASIFLWDKDHQRLIARPALGVDDGELQVPDDVGVVGQVIRDGQPRRVDPERTEAIDRSVDQQLHFTTRSLVCVPLWNQQREVIGAFEVLNKQDRDSRFSLEDERALQELADHAALALEDSRQYEQLLRSRNQLADAAAEGVELIGQCPAMLALRDTIDRVAETDLAALVLGENGTGKEVISQLLHYRSRRRREPLVAVNCAALPESLLESELFGHERGAFTDAQESRAGKFEQAAGGTLFLDEIGDLSVNAQAKLLRVLEEKIVVRVGGSQSIATDVRIIAATNRPLAELVQSGQFRQDLFFRLTVVVLEIPPLRDREDDILLLAEHFLKRFARDAGRRSPAISASARQRLKSHSWPGNVRELRNLMERLAYLTQQPTIEATDLQFSLMGGVADLESLDDQPLAAATRDFQRRHIQRQIDRARGNMTEAAERLGLHRSNLYRKMKQLDLDPEED